jgi:tRNA(Leu) C34 or U34 (ribose-2'-O)-methylase TrmL
MKRGYAAIGLMNPKTNANVGGVLRAMACYEASMLAIQGTRYTRAATDTTKAYRHLPVVHGDLRSLIPFDCVPVAVDLVDGARPLHTYQHPERAFYIFGPEDSTLGKDVLAWCPHRLYVPTNGCMNLAATVNVILYDRLAKQMKEERQFLRGAA